MRIIILDPSTSPSRGGSVYLERVYRYMKECGRNCVIVRKRDGRLRFFVSTIWYVLTSWVSSDEIRGNGPWVLGIAMVAKKSSVYVGSPVHQWSKRSRQLLAWTCRLRKISFLAASRYVKAEILKYTKDSDVYVSYAKIQDSGIRKRYIQKRDSQIVLVVMAAGDQSKGWMRSVAIIQGLRHLSPKVVVYGKQREEDMALLEGVEVVKKGFRDQPFRDLVKEFPSQMHFYIGMSIYEGLHMAVVEAGLEGVPSILSNIPAHRELEEIGGGALLIEDTPVSAISTLIKITRDVTLYRELTQTYNRMAVKFLEIANSSELNG